MASNFSKEQISKSLDIAKELQESRKKSKANPFAERMRPIIQSPESKHFLIRLMDVAFRSTNYDRVAAFVVRLFNSTDSYNNLFTGSEKVMVRLFRSIGYKLPSVSVPAMHYQIRDVTSPILYFVGDKKFKRHAEKRRNQGIQLNVNLIGEALVGEGEADERIKRYIYLLNQEEVNYISIKISTIYSQIYPLGYEYSVKRLVEKLSILYDEVLRIERETGIQKFVNLDMEEYRDLSLTIDTFVQTLSLSQYKNLRAGIVLQAYLPDSYNKMLYLRNWAQERVTNGGAPIKIRIVKGANLEMEKTESSLEDWPLVTYSEKIESDANFKKILSEMLTEESAKAVNVGVASHNIFDLSFALSLVKQNKLESYVDFELLEGMADATVGELLNKDLSIILYTPIVKEEDYNSAVAYLVRRLDEGTQDGNFLKEGFGLKTGTDRWEELKEQYLKSLNLIDTVSTVPNRIQNRASEEYEIQEYFTNVANTDWTLRANRDWIQTIKERWEFPEKIFGSIIHVGGELKEKKREVSGMIGWNGNHPWQYELADKEDYENVINSGSEWYDYSVEKRAGLLRKAGEEINKRRGDLIGAAVAELGKTVYEVDIEVSEAIDFANFYASSMDKISLEGMKTIDGGINLVLSPWNFPVAIPAGGVLASLAAGKRVILKPSMNAAGCSSIICDCLWKAGIPKSALSFLPASEETLDPFLSEGNVFDAVILTGGTGTAKFLLDRNPRLNLYAETGGKNATIVTSLSDREQAIKNVVQSAFGNTGQKCSATSLLILEKEVYEDEHFKKLLKDAAESKIHGNPWNLETQIGPLAVPVSDKLLQSIETTDEDQWLLKPILNGKFMLSPGIKWGVTKEDYEYQNELFGPILSVMMARGLADAVELVNGVEYGLTSGIETLAREEIWYWQNAVKAGNLYANRSTTGAIVLRQPFGGMKESSFGFGMKAGGPNYVLQFSNIEEVDKVSINEVRIDYKKWFDIHFNKEIDYVKLRGQHNINRYLFPDKVFVLIDDDTSNQDIMRVEAAAKTLRVKTKYYALDERTIPMSAEFDILKEWSDIEDELSHNIVVRALNYERLDDDFLKLCHERAIHVYGRKPSCYGRLELLNYVIEQNRSINYHRYGNLLGEKPLED
ncbi:proline dehydrogenase family protein [Membranihabitans maritimus]|uniref:proline dehydrogenase family protein n=1 Tax=Membranihabitans maritimus TaxID=2904244 RepID=UPI001F31912B|nr:bifunctional proline dehydrogenase/L-glutamate gamma-semialdehyde dehydrogenase [Membranihabitans maritimus]